MKYLFGLSHDWLDKSKVYGAANAYHALAIHLDSQDTLFVFDDKGDLVGAAPVNDEFFGGLIRQAKIQFPDHIAKPTWVDDSDTMAFWLYAWLAYLNDEHPKVFKKASEWFGQKLLDHCYMKEVA